MEILATIPVYGHPFYCDLLLAVTIIKVFIGLMVGVFIAVEERSWVACVIGFSLLVIGFIGIKSSSDLMKEQEVFKYNKYKVTLDETISARELLDKYEILSREGEIFTIKEKNKDE